MCKGTTFFLHGKRHAFVRKNDGFRTKKREDPFGSSLPNTLMQKTLSSFSYSTVLVPVRTQASAPGNQIRTG